MTNFIIILRKKNIGQKFEFNWKYDDDDRRMDMCICVSADAYEISRFARGEPIEIFTESHIHLNGAHTHAHTQTI